MSDHITDDIKYNVGDPLFEDIDGFVCLRFKDDIRSLKNLEINPSSEVTHFEYHFDRDWNLIEIRRFVEELAGWKDGEVICSDNNIELYIKNINENPIYMQFGRYRIGAREIR